MNAAVNIDWEWWLRYQGLGRFTLTCQSPGCCHPATLIGPSCHHQRCKGHEEGDCPVCLGVARPCNVACRPWQEREWREHFGVLTELA